MTEECEYGSCDREWSHLVFYDGLDRAGRYCDPHAREETGKHDDARLFEEADPRA